MTYAVTAATGQLGRAIVSELIAQYGESSVIAVCRDASKASDLPCEKRIASYGDLASLEKALKDVDAVCIISLNGDPSVRLPLHASVVDAAKLSGVKRVVFTSIMGGKAPGHSLWYNLIKSNRDTEELLKSSGLDYVIGRNGLYIEPDVAYIETYKEEGEVSNCAGRGRCCYTTRPELAKAYASLMSEQHLRNKTFNLCGEPLTQRQLVSHLNNTFETDLIYRSVTEEDYLDDRKQALGDLMGQIIAGIYAAIAQEDNVGPSDFQQAVGRPHQSWENYFANLKHHSLSDI